MERKCAIYNRLSYDNTDKLKKIREELVECCKNDLLINDYVVFEEIASVEDERKEFNEMIRRIQDKEFTDLLVYHPDRIYKATYNKEKFDKIIKEIAKYNIQLHSIIKKENNIDNEELIKEYFELIKMDKEYEDKYCQIDSQEAIVRETYKLFRDGIGIWKHVRSIYDIINIIEADRGFELLRIEDTYVDEYSDLIRKYFKVDYLNLTEEEHDKLYEEKYMKELLRGKDTADDLKACIDIVLKARDVCKRLYEYVANRKK